MPVHQRLAATDGKFLMEEILTKIKSELELRDCTFKPKLVAKPSKTAATDASQPVHVRLNQVGEQLRAEQVRKEAEKIAGELGQATFAPAINPISVLLASHRKSVTGEGDLDVYSRLSLPVPPVEELHYHEVYDESYREPNTPGGTKRNMTEEEVEKMVERLATKHDHKFRSVIPPSPEPRSKLVKGGEVDKIVERLYSQHTKSFECSQHNAPNNAADLEAMYNKKVVSKSERELQKVFKRLSAPVEDISSDHFIVNPMASSDLLETTGSSTSAKSQMHSIFFNHNSLSPLTTKKLQRASSKNSLIDSSEVPPQNTAATPKVIPRLPKSSSSIKPSRTDDSLDGLQFEGNATDNVSNNLDDHHFKPISETCSMDNNLLSFPADKKQPCSIDNTLLSFPADKKQPCSMDNNLLSFPADKKQPCSIDNTLLSFPADKKQPAGGDYFIGKKIPSLAEIDKYVAAIASANAAVVSPKKSKQSSKSLPQLSIPSQDTHDNNFAALKMTENMLIREEVVDISPAVSVVSHSSEQTSGTIVVESTSNEDSNNNTDDQSEEDPNGRRRRARSTEFLSKIEKFNNNDATKTNFSVRQAYLDAAIKKGLSPSKQPIASTLNQDVGSEQKPKVLRGQKKRSESNMESEN